MRAKARVRLSLEAQRPGRGAKKWPDPPAQLRFGRPNLRVFLKWPVLWIHEPKRQLSLTGDRHTVAQSGFKLPLFGGLHGVGREQSSKARVVSRRPRSGDLTVNIDINENRYDHLFMKQ